MRRRSADRTLKKYAEASAVEDLKMSVDDSRSVLEEMRKSGAVQEQRLATLEKIVSKIEGDGSTVGWLPKIETNLESLKDQIITLASEVRVLGAKKEADYAPRIYALESKMYQVEKEQTEAAKERPQIMKIVYGASALAAALFLAIAAGSFVIELKKALEEPPQYQQSRPTQQAPDR